MVKALMMRGNELGRGRNADIAIDHPDRMTDRRLDS
jgi:hypothetical protein